MGRRDHRKHHRHRSRGERRRRRSRSDSSSDDVSFVDRHDRHNRRHHHRHHYENSRRHRRSRSRGTKERSRENGQLDVERELTLSPAPPRRTDDVPFCGPSKLLTSSAAVEGGSCELVVAAADVQSTTSSSAVIPPADPSILMMIRERTTPPPPLMSLEIPAPPKRDKKSRRSRWIGSESDKTCIPGMPTSIPTNLTREQEQVYILQLQIEEITYRLRLLEQGIAGVSIVSSSSSAISSSQTTSTGSDNAPPRSPSPDPVYDLQGRRTNTREARIKRKLEEERHSYVQKILKIKPEYKPPADYKPVIPRHIERIVIPQNEYPEINFLGILIGPRGNSLKKLEQDTGAKIVIRGRGSSKDIRINHEEGDDDVLHAQITGTTPEIMKLAAERIREVIRKGIEEPETLEERRKTQLRELAILNGTYRENESLSRLKMLAEAESIVTNTIICAICGGVGHVAADCLQKGEELEPFNPNNDPEYKALMEELGSDVCPSLLGREFALLKGVTGPGGGSFSGHLLSGKTEPLLALPVCESDLKSSTSTVESTTVIPKSKPVPAADVSSLTLTSMKATSDYGKNAVAPGSSRPLKLDHFDFNLGVDSVGPPKRSQLSKDVEFARFMDESIPNRQETIVDEDDPFGCRAAGIDPVAVGLVADPVLIKHTTAVSLQPQLAAALAAFTPSNTNVDPMSMASTNASRAPTSHPGYNPQFLAPPPTLPPQQQQPVAPSVSYMMTFMQQYVNAASAFAALQQTQPTSIPSQQTSSASLPQTSPVPSFAALSAQPAPSAKAPTADKESTTKDPYAAALAAAAMTNALPTSHQMLSTWLKSREDSSISESAAADQFVQK